MLRFNCLHSTVGLLGFAFFYMHPPVSTTAGAPAVPAFAQSQEAAAVTVAPVEELTDRTLEAATDYVARFTITNRGSKRDVFHFACSGMRVRCEAVRPAQVAVPSGGTGHIVVFFTTAEVGRGLLAVTAFSPTTLARGQSTQMFDVRQGGQQP